MDVTGKDGPEHTLATPKQRMRDLRRDESEATKFQDSISNYGALE